MGPNGSPWVSPSGGTGHFEIAGMTVTQYESDALASAFRAPYECRLRGPCVTCLSRHFDLGGTDPDGDFIAFGVPLPWEF